MTPIKNRINLQLPDGSRFGLENTPGITYIIGPNGVGKSYALKKFARENPEEVLYILPSRKDVRRNLTPAERGDERQFFNEWLAYEQLRRYWYRTLRQPGLLALALSFLERLGVPQRFSVSMEDGTFKFHPSESDSFSPGVSQPAGLLNLPMLGIAVYDPSRKLVIIDEPEQSLHPQAQHIFVSVLREVARIQDKHFILSTHSPSMVDIRGKDDLSRIFFIRRSKKNKQHRKIFRINPVDTEEYAELIPGLTTYKREIFFADKVIMVEGQHDRDVLSALVEGGGFGVSLARTSILPMGGFGSMAKYTAFFKEIGVKPFVICDRDTVYPNSSIRWSSARSDTGNFDWKGWVNPNTARLYVDGQKDAAKNLEANMDPARFEHLEQLARKLGKALKKALTELENNITTGQQLPSLGPALEEMAKKTAVGCDCRDYKEFKVFHEILSAVLKENDWRNSAFADSFVLVEADYNAFETLAAQLDILLLRDGRLEDIYLHGGRQGLTKTEKSLAEARDIRRIYAGNPHLIDEDYFQLINPLKEKKFIQRINLGLPHEAAAIIAGKLHEIYDYVFGSGKIADRVQKLSDSGKLEELSSGAAVTEWKEDSADNHVVLSIPLLRGYLSDDGSIRLTSSKRPDFFKLLYQGIQL
ncbi:MAG: ATPase AAA [Peptococcaceae bacterium BRH_c4b]|nr:MAG: ATPase AAA [Peptococcaceae bacterium BRH_c4b]